MHCWIKTTEENLIVSNCLYRRKIDEITKEIKQLENNISFISNASADNPLVKNVYKNIETYKESLEIWKRKIDYMKKMEY